ncbi:MAG: ATP-dependent RNA helicase [Bradymonadaceae bacterium]|nr:ATP-dependent RNA helicase [Lujinxingiaceae bacterium]
MHKLTNALPIDAIGDAFRRALGADTLVVVAPTGSGKSTRLPLWMADALDGPILVVEPRRVACRSLAGFLAQSRGEKVGESIGYRVRFEDKSSAKTQVLFATTGVVLRMMSELDQWPYRGVLIDEFHERGWEVDLIVAALTHAQNQHRIKGPLVITSATLDAASVASKLDATVLEAMGRSFPVAIAHLGSSSSPSTDDLEGRVRAAISKVLESKDEGDILVFLPGKGEISACEQALRPLSRSANFDLVPVHGSLTPESIMRAFEDEAARRRVFLSTNVAETSVTLPGVTVVIDTGVARMRIHRAGRSALALVPISQASMDQRAGRAGRVSPGRCLRLWSERYSPELATAPEITRIELDDVVLQAAILGLDGPHFDGACWITAPPAFAVSEARRRLRKAGALDDADALTALGRRMAELPVGGDEARLLIDPPAELADILAELVALLQRGTDLLLPLHFLPTERQDKIRDARQELLAGVDNEVYVQLECLRHGSVHRHGLHGAALEEVRKIARNLRATRGRGTGVRPPDALDSTGFPAPDVLADYILSRIPQAAFVVRARALKRRVDGRPQAGRPEPWANEQTELAVWPFEPLLAPRQSRQAPYPVAGLVLDHFWLGDGAMGVRGTGRMVLPCTYAQLARARVGSQSVGETQLVRKGGSTRFFGQLVHELAGVVIDEREQRLEGAPLRAAVAQAIVDNRVLKPAGERVANDLHLWEVLASWPEMDRHWNEHIDAPVELHGYLTSRLEALGLEHDDELAMLEADDLRPDLVALTGIAHFELEAMAEEFPRIWEHQGASYRCIVRPRSKKVILEPIDKKTSRGPDPQPRFLPRFRSFTVYYQKASRIIQLR